METIDVLKSASGEESDYCSARSLQAGEAIFGTATQTQAYLLLEYNGAWGAKAVPESGLPEAVKARLIGLTKELPNCKALLIRSDRRRAAQGFTFFVARTGESHPALHAFHLAEYKDLLELDIPAILAGERQYEGQLLEQPLYLVCTHGRRDKCCAKFGLPVYQALDQLTGESTGADYQQNGTPIPAVWQCSHIGGHRFAVNLICLPFGLLYGRVDPDNAAAILDATRQGKIHLPNLRGRTCYEEMVQAAELLLREKSGESAIDAYHLQGTETLEPNKWRVSFSQKTPAGERVHQISLRLHVSEQQVFQGCTLDKQSAQKRYELGKYRRLSDPPHKNQ